MRKLWILGDSFSCGFFTNKIEKQSFKAKYTNYKGYQPKFFGDFISENLGISYEILTPDAHDNHKMLITFIDNIDKINDGDIISFGWTDPSRLSIVDTKINSWKIVNAHNMYGERYNDDFSIQTLVEMATNRLHVLYIEDLKKWMKIVDRLVPNSKVIHWSWTRGLLDNFETIKQETKGEIDDFHWSENGHRLFAEWFLNVLNNKIENKCYK